ncbi:hypothetical protein HYH02_004877 [Chlamydomonas schloesseri]|uniref:Uncharacterized protein n=1 Tax=Chlamydomonas schloesseri TaxID=2026947 RepID=A0A835WM86_9CHLO|nr:hypothetical protein HYH02_004877 [Chlamydomonas schloesseri]|eukprot:KAG2450373.1 hypothetical protein HYH02_004877 [Chlamydomonas schloesseri]
MKLWDRATHVFFLRALAKHKIPGSTKGGVLGDVATWMVVKEFVRPATAHTKSDFVQALVNGQLPPSYSLPWCGPGGRMDAAAAVGGDEGAGGGGRLAAPTAQAMFGATTFFASHAWSYKFSELVELLEGHYNALPDSQGGAAYVPVFYWVDILAVTQHFSGDFKDHPDSNFPGVIKASRAVLFTMHPWRSPVAPTRVWCLFEALTAVESKGVGLEVLLDTRDSADTRPQTLLAIVSSINVLTAQATVASDKAYIMDCIARGLGAAAFNATLKRLLRAALLDTMVRKAFRAARTADDAVTYGPLVELLKTNGRHLPNGVVDVPKLMPYAAATDVISLVSSFSAANCPRVLVLSGRDGCTEERTRRHVGGTDKDWVVDYYSACLKIWSYLPLTNKAAGALGRMLTKLASGDGSAGGAAAAAATRPALGSSSSIGPAGAAIGSAGPLRAVRGAIPTPNATAAGGSNSSSGSASLPSPSSTSSAAVAASGAIAGRRAGLGTTAGSSSSSAATAATATGTATGARASPIAGRRAVGGNALSPAAGGSSINPSASPATSSTTAAARSPIGGGVGGGGSGGGIRASAGGGIGGGGGGGGEDDADDPAGGGGGGPGLQELWLRLGNAAPPIRWRQPLGDKDKGMFTAEEVARAAKPEDFRAWKKKQDPKWRSVHEVEGLPPHLIKQMGLDWQENEEFEKWKDAALTQLAMQRATTKDAPARAALERQERAERAELWRGLAAYGALRVLCLHRSVLCAEDVRQLGAVLRSSRGLRELLLIECEAEEEGTPTPGAATRGRGFGGAGTTAPLTARLLAAALGGSGSLARLTLTPPRLAAVEAWEPGMTAAALSAGGGGRGLEELVLAPVALGPAAAKQLAEVLAALPALLGGAVDCLKAPPLTAPPAAAADEMRADLTIPFKPPESYPKTLPQEALRKTDWRIQYPRGTTHEVLRSTRTPDLSYYPQYSRPVPAAEVAALPHVLHLASASGGTAQPAQRVAVLTHWLSAVAAGPAPAAAAVARAKAAAARTTAIVAEPTESESAGGPEVDESLLETDVEVGPASGVEARMAGLRAAAGEVEAAALKAAGGCAYATCWPHLVPLSRRQGLLGPDADRLVSEAPRPPPLPAAPSAAAPSPGGGGGSSLTDGPNALAALFGGVAVSQGSSSTPGGLLGRAGAADATAGGVPAAHGAAVAGEAADSDDDDDDFSDLDNVGWRPQPGLKWQ